MNYDTLYEAFKKEFPEGQRYFEKLEQENYIDESDGMHPVFGMVVVPYILQVVRENGLLEIRKVALFLEKMALCDDADVVDVLDFTVLEQLIDEDRSILEICKKHMGEYTLKHCEEIEKYFL